MTNILDLNPILIKNRDQAYIDNIFYLAKNAPTPELRVFWGEIKLALQFDLYHAETGTYHPNDPNRLDEDNSVQNDPNTI